MRKIAVVTDTASDIANSQIEQYNIKILHYQIVYKEKTYKDQLEITSKEVLEHLDEEVPSTSLPALDEIHEVLNKLQEEGYEEVIVIPISSGLSGCYNAINMIKEEYPKLRTVVYDSRTLSIAQGVLVLRAAELAEQGYEMEEIIKALDEMRNNQRTLFIVDTLKYLVLGGRIGHVSATIGKLLNLKPLITIGEDGKYTTVTKVRGRTKAISCFAELVEEVFEKNGEYKIYFTHANGEEILNKIIEAIKQVKSSIQIESVSPISPVACVHCGPGYIGMLIQKV